MAGYGTIERSRLRILLLGGPERAEELEATARALAPRHEATVLCNTGGLRAKLRAARAASELDPHLVHAIGTDGIAKAAATIAAGVGRPLVATIDGDEIQERAKGVLAFAQRAYGVVLDTQASADALRARGVERPLYVTSAPMLSRPDDDPHYLGSIEIVYGRVIDAAGVALEENVPKTGVGEDGAPLVGIGGLGRGDRS